MYYVITAALAWLVALPALAQQPAPTRPDIQLQPVGSLRTITDLLEIITRYVWMLATPIIVIMVMWGGFKILVAKDNKGQFESGKETIKQAVIGAAVILLAQSAMYIIIELFDVDRNAVGL